MTGGARADLAAFVAPLARAGAITAAVMVTSVDGRATIDGRVGALTGEADQQVLLGARELAAVVVVGGGTVRAEGYEGLLGEEAQARRRARGLAAEPELAVLTRESGGLPAGAMVLSPPPLADGRPDLAAAWRELRERHGEGLILCEGGPRLLGQLAQQRLLDQLVLCISPQLVGAQEGRRLTEGAGALAQAPLRLALLDVVSAEDFLFVRYGAAP